MDPLLSQWEVLSSVREQGYEMNHAERGFTQEIRTFLDEWVERMQPKYMAVSLTPDFRYPDDSYRSEILDLCILPFARTQTALCTDDRSEAAGESPVETCR